MSFSSSLKHGLFTDNLDTPTIRQWREQTLAILLYGMVIFGGIAVLASIYNALQDNRLERAGGYVLIYLLIVVVATRHQIGFSVRAIFLLAACYGIALQDLVLYGYTTDSFLFLVTAIMLAALFFGWRQAFAMLLLSLVSLGVVGWGLASGWVKLTIDPSVDATDPAELASHAVVFLLLAVIIVSAVWSLIVRLGHSIAAASTAREQAEQAAQRAEHAAQQAAAARQQAEQQAIVLAQQSAALQYTEHQLRDLVATLETPTVALAHGVLMAPLVGMIDSRRAQQLTARLLADVQQQRAHLVVIDVAGVAVIDTQVAQALIEAAQALRLLGCRVALTGVTPHMASALIHLGVSLDGIDTAHSPQDVLSA